MPDAADSAPGALIRLGAGAASVALGFAAVWLFLQNLRFSLWDGWYFWMPVTLLLMALAALCASYAAWGDRAESRAAIRATWRGGVRVGTWSFALGFIGPLVVWPDANLGPLLGILITGPFGFVGGALVALHLWKRRSIRLFTPPHAPSETPP